MDAASDRKPGAGKHGTGSPANPAHGGEGPCVPPFCVPAGMPPMLPPKQAKGPRAARGGGGGGPGDGADDDADRAVWTAPRLLVMGGCSGSTAVFDVASVVLARHGVHVYNAPREVLRTDHVMREFGAVLHDGTSRLFLRLCGHLCEPTRRI